MEKFVCNALEHQNRPGQTSQTDFCALTALKLTLKVEFFLKAI